MFGEVYRLMMQIKKLIKKNSNKILLETRCCHYKRIFKPLFDLK
jgi:hypothetical protein